VLDISRRQIERGRRWHASGTVDDAIGLGRMFGAVIG